MKRLFVTFCLISIGYAAAFAQAVIKFDKQAHNFGTFPESKVVSYVFGFANTGNQPLVIHQVISTCGCTVADHTKTEIKPGEKGQISVFYNGRGKSAGHFKKAITIRSNASNSLTRIYIEGNMTIDK